jgi:hypothetical protein
MGGHALRRVQVARFDIETYNAVKKDICEKLGSMVEMAFIRESPGKCDFGDLDVLYKYSPAQDITAIIQSIFHPIEYVLNGNVLSFSFSHSYSESEKKNTNTEENKDVYYQIDMIKIDNIAMGQFYFGYGDTGNILGRMLRESEIFLGSQGLFCREDYADILLCDDPEQICDYLGLSYTAWKNITDVESLFSWILSCRFYVNQFHVRSKDRSKRKTRPMLDKYMAYIVDKPGTYAIENRQEEALDHFNKIHVRDGMRKKKEILRERKKKFNGTKVMEMTEGKMTEGKMTERKMTEGKMTERKMTEGKMTERKMTGEKLGNLLRDIVSVIETETKMKFDEWLDIHDEKYIDIQVMKIIQT